MELFSDEKTTAIADREPESSGLQALDRALAVMSAVARTGSSGLRLTDLSNQTGLSKATIHRLATALVRAGLVDLDEASRRYLPGIEMFRLGVAAGERFNLRGLALPSMQRLAAATGDTIYLSVVVDTHAVCVAREVGAFPIKTLTLNVGDRRPLGVGAGSLALLAAHTDAQVDALLAANAEMLKSYAGFEPVALRGLVAQTRANGFATNDGRLVAGMSALAVPVVDGRGRLVGALSIAAIDSRMATERRHGIIQLLQQEAVAIRKLHMLESLSLVSTEAA